MVVSEQSGSLLIACLNLAGSIGVAIGMRVLYRRLAWRDEVDRELRLFRRKFQRLEDKYDLDTTIKDD